MDLIRGAVMVLMTLDHVRWFVNSSEPTDLTQTTFALFMTRWVTGICAPAFVFLAGVGSYLYEHRISCEDPAKRKARVSRFLWTRGLWLIFLEITVISFGWYFGTRILTLQVIWVIGVGMLMLSALVYAPVLLTTTVGVVMIAAHNLLDPFTPSSYEFVWSLLHHYQLFEISPHFSVDVLYALIPWVGVLLVGYGCGFIWKMDHACRKRILASLGGASIVAFLLMRWFNTYGNVYRWEPQPDVLMTVASFLKCNKYPPSLVYCLMSMGPVLLMLALFDRSVPAFFRWLAVLGRVPLFYYLLHIYVIHFSVIGLSWVQTGDPWFCRYENRVNWGDRFGLGLVGIYILATCVVLALYYPSTWFGKMKRRYSSVWWLKYL